MDTKNIYHAAVEATHPPRSHCRNTRKFMMQPVDKKKNKKYKKKSIIDCICNSKDELIKPAEFEETCHIFDMTENYFGISSSQLLSLEKYVTEIIYPFYKKYDFYRINYNHKFNFFPVAIVRAHTIEDIISTINFCKKFNLPLRARGGAHCYEPASLVNYGIVLDQRPRENVTKINLKKYTAKIQAGALLGPVMDALAKQNVMIPFGTCVTNGLAGLTLGGGIGFSLREYGLTLDNVVDMKVVLADGEIVHANNDTNKDLFWALRGAGGGNFGVVTDFKFRIYPVEWVTVFTMNFNFDDTKNVFMVWQTWAPNVNTKLTSEFDIHNKFQPVIVTGQLLPIKNPKSDKKLLFELLTPLIELGLHIDFSIKTMSQKESSEYFGQSSYARPLFFYNKSDFNFEPLCEGAIDTIVHHMGLLDEFQSYHKTEIDALGGNFANIPPDATAFPSRSAIHWLQYTSLWDTSDQENINMTWLKNYYNDMRRFFPENMKYVNALDYDVCPDVALGSYYGDNLGRLIKIKQKYDPDNFFNFEQSIPVLS